MRRSHAVILGALVALITTLPFSAFAYIPKFWMIMSRTAENHGRGAYLVEQEVTFPLATQSLQVIEKWTVDGEDSMRLQVTGRGPLKDKIRLNIVYSGRNKHFVDANGVRKTTRVAGDWAEPFFYFRFSAKIKPLMHSLQMIPAEALQAPSPQKLTSDAAESYMRLGRSQGKVAYAIGRPTPLGSSENYSGMWIEQDAFNVLKVRFPSQSVMTADQYQKHDREFWFPKTRLVEWDQNRAKIQALRVTSLAAGPKLKESLSASSLEFGKDPSLATLLPDEQVVVDFYQRFR